uniref:Uncharacterized protein n=1 Tax=Setaria digitata TaxID=48799 RepID=A0A915PRK4_9BILA
MLSMWFQNITSTYPIIPILSQTSSSSSSSFAETMVSENINVPLSLPSLLPLSAFPPADPFMMTTSFPITLIRGDKLQTINLQLQLTANDSGMTWNYF